MSRPLRIHYPGAWYLVSNRGSARQPVFPSDENRNQFLNLLTETSKLFEIECHAYCLMELHYSLLLHTPRANLSRGMRHLNGVYTQRYNRSEGTDGSLFRGRYKSILLDPETYLLPVSRLVHLIPVLEQVSDTPEGYHWSSYTSYIHDSAPLPWLRTDRLLSAISKRQPRRHYQSYVEEGLDEEMNSFYGRGRQSPILGSSEFRQQAERHLDPNTDWREVPELGQVRPLPTIEQILEACALSYEVDRAELLRDGRGRDSEPRTVAMALCRRVGAHRLTDIAAVFRVSYATVSSAVARVRDWAEADSEFAEWLEKMEQSLRRRASGN